MARPSSPQENQNIESKMSGGGSSSTSIVGSLKKRFLKKWISSLKSCSSLKNLTNLNDRRNFIKLTADLTMASLRDGSTRWSRALIDTASCDAENKLLVQQIMSHQSSNTDILDRTSLMPRKSLASFAKKIRSKKIVKRSRAGPRRVVRKDVSSINGCYRPTASCVAKRLLKKRTQLLKNLVPGGESMDDMSLIKETLDYIVSLQAQVHVMRALAGATELALNK